jgi:uncharacterized membrane protein
MASESGTPVDLYIVTYSGPETARADWDDIKRMAEQKVIAFNALVLVSRGTDGKIDIEDNAHGKGDATKIGVVGGLLVGALFPPSLLVSGLVGGGIGAGVSRLRSHSEKQEIEADIEDDLPPGSSAIVGLFDARWAADIFEKSLPKADKVIKHEVDPESAEQVKNPASGDA